MQEREYRTARLILRLSNQIIRNRDNHVKELGLTTEQADSLQFFLSHERSVIMDLKNYLGVSHQTARGIVQRMEGKGLIRLQKSETDGRFQCIQVSEKGKSLGWQLRINGIRTGNKLLKNMKPEEQEEFYHLLEVALKNVEGAMEDEYNE